VTSKHALVTGAYGIVGLNVIKELQTRGDWSVLPIGRREKPPLPDLAYVRADLLDPQATQDALADAGHCTHLFFGALQYLPDPYEESSLNVGPLCAPYIRERLVSQEISTRDHSQKTVQRSLLRRDLSAWRSRKCTDFERSPIEIPKKRPPVRISSAPATRHCEPQVPFEPHHRHKPCFPSHGGWTILSR
jgi:hypothetical protein